MNLKLKFKSDPIQEDQLYRVNDTYTYDNLRQIIPTITYITYKPKIVLNYESI